MTKALDLARLAADERTPQHEREAAALALAKIVARDGVPRSRSDLAGVLFRAQLQVDVLTAEKARLEGEVDRARAEIARLRGEPTGALFDWEAADKRRAEARRKYVDVSNEQVREELKRRASK